MSDLYFSKATLVVDFLHLIGERTIRSKRVRKLNSGSISSYYGPVRIFVVTAMNLLENLKISFVLEVVGRDNVDGAETRYGLGGSGIEPRWVMRFFAPIQTGSGAQPASYTIGTVYFPGGKRPGSGADHQLSSSAEVKERVELYLYFLSGSSWHVKGQNLLLPLLFCR